MAAGCRTQTHGVHGEQAVEAFVAPATRLHADEAEARPHRDRQPAH
jgi:hypothetical protein